jgi:DNA-binding LytR/AlgR family response regulator
MNRPDAPSDASSPAADRVVTALIAEDEPLLAQGLEAELRRAWPSLSIVARADDGNGALDQALARRPEVCFLDIRMPGLSGLEVAEALAEEWPDGAPLPLLVFVTAYEQYAVQAFAAHAFDYLLKPLDAGRLDETVARLQRRLAERAAVDAGTGAPAGAGADAAVPLEQLRALLAGLAPAPRDRLEVIQAQVGTVVTLVPVDEVVYFEAADKYVRVVTAEREHLIRVPLKELLPRLDPQRFWQVHRGTVVQARCIAQARRDESGKVLLTLRNRPETLVASRLYAHLFKGM